jgi:hypothetical protein
MRSPDIGRVIGRLTPRTFQHADVALGVASASPRQLAPPCELLPPEASTSELLAIDVALLVAKRAFLAK